MTRHRVCVVLSGGWVIPGCTARPLGVIFLEKLGLSTTAWIMYLHSCSVESQVGLSSRDVIYFMKQSSEDVLYLYSHTHYVGRTDTFECFPWGEDVDEEHCNCTSPAYLMRRGRRLYSGAHSAELHGEKRGLT